MKAPLDSISILIGSLLFMMSCSVSQDPSASLPLKEEKTILKASSSVKALPDNAPELLNKEELLVLLKRKGENTPERRKMDKLFRTPFVDNSHYRRHGMPSPLRNPILGKSLRVTTWNIEKSIHVHEAANALRSEKQFIANLTPEILADEKKNAEALRQRGDIAHSDILLLQEMDIGHSRSGYLFAAQKMARETGMNFVYAPQQLEIDPVYLGVEDAQFGNSGLDHAARKRLRGDGAKYHGVFGVAVLSRYPIKGIQIFPLKNQPYDWYDDEMEKPDLLEKGRRLGAAVLFNVKPMREMKVGGRGFTRVDLHVPGVPDDTITVINIHLEIKARPENRTEQMREILTYIRDIKNPVIMAGDHNSAPTDVSSTSVERAVARTATDPSKLASAGLYLANITGINQARNIINGYKNFQDPLAISIPVLLPNKTRSLFKLIEDYRFNDGGAFDFRGDRIRSTDRNAGTLSNANHRSVFKGFTQTFTLPRTIGPAGCERLDWIFVKSYLKDSKEHKGPYKLAPHFGETLNLMNDAVSQPYSDHHPITAIIPFDEPKVSDLKRQ